ncbi:2',3'-cyclic-nucleotide 3'-phosphodiesterase [Trametes polyzona]|nr:2',3'-cyclic-nucleotide 3'-phosphodiesterase [Trametes polyzona]
MGISLWLVPRASQAAKIALTMRVKPSSGVTRSPSSFPPFHPHVTLASGPDAAALRAAIPPDQGVIPVRFKSLEVGEKYFMSVYVAVHSAPGTPLEALREHLRRTLDESAVPPVAHLSLYYIDDADAEERARTAETLRSELRVLESAGGEGEVRSVRLACVDEEAGQEPEILEGFDGEEIWVVKCEGPVPGWEVLEKIPLRQ